MFENAFPGQTLVQVLSNGGGGLNALGRQTVSALLNAAGLQPNFGLSTGAVITDFNNVFPGTKDQYTTLQNLFDGMTDDNPNITCPLNGTIFPPPT